MADRDYTISGPDGRELTITGPDTATPDQLRAAAEKAFSAQPIASQAGPSLADRIGGGIRDAAAGAVRGAGSIGATLLAPLDAAARAVGIDPNGVVGSIVGRTDRREAMTRALGTMGADTDSLAFQAGKMGAEIAGTAGVGGTLANGLARVPGVVAAAPGFINAVRTGGMTAGSGAANLGTRIAGGALTGAASAGLVNPDDAGAGGAIGAALPPVLKAAGAVGNVAGKAIRGGGTSDEVRTLAKRAQELGIEIPADRLVNSKPLDALASGLNYVPFSGRAATESRMGEQLNRAASRLMGQDTTNINKALRAASADLGAKFDSTLKNTGVAFDHQLLEDVTGVFNTAERELGSDALKPIAAQVDELVSKGATGVVDGQAAYNIKRALDRIGNGNTPTAYHALELKRVLMDALNRSLGPEGSQAFAQTRQQYGNMLALEKLAKNGVEGEISVARLANLKNINNGPLQELADIAAQFVKPRESQHGGAQRAGVGVLAGLLGGAPGVAATVATGRGLNTALNSNPLRALMLREPPSALDQLAYPELRQLGYRAAPVASSDR